VGPVLIFDFRLFIGDWGTGLPVWVKFEQTGTPTWRKGCRRRHDQLQHLARRLLPGE
jgi:hypothetical protein